MYLAVFYEKMPGMTDKWFAQTAKDMECQFVTFNGFPAFSFESSADMESCVADHRAGGWPEEALAAVVVTAQ